MPLFALRIILLIGCCSYLLNAQDIKAPQMKPKENPWLYIGGYADYNNNVFSADLKGLPGFPSCCPDYTQGTGSGFALGVLAEYPLTPFLRFETRLGYTNLSGRLFKTEVIGRTNDIGATNNITDVEVQYEIFSKLHAVSIEPAISLLFFSRIHAQVGYRAALLMTKSFTQNETLLSPDNVFFVADSSRTRNAFSGDIPNINTLQHAASVSVGIDFPVSSRSTLTPEFRYYLPLNNITDAEWNVATMQLGAAFRYALYPPPPPLLINDTLLLRDTTVKTIVGLDKESLKMVDRQLRTDETRDDSGEREIIHTTTTITEKYLREVPKLAALNLTVEAYSLDGGNRSSVTKFNVEETEVEENFPLLPQIFFPEGIGEINASSMQHLTPDETNDFNESKLPRNTLEVYHHLLNLVGSRMNLNPSAKLTVVGCNSNVNTEKANRELSASRADAVKRYLTDVWKVEPGRIITRAQNLPSSPANNTTEDGQAENRRVELYSDNAEILKPVSVKDVTVESNPPIIELVPKVESEAGIKSWTATFEQDGARIRSFNGTGDPQRYTWKVTDKPYPKTESPVTVSYSVTDNTNQKMSAETSFDVKQLTLKTKRFEQRDDKRIDRFSLIVFDFNKADLNPDNKRIVQEVKSRIQPESKIVIAGYADRSGEPEYNRELARRRCVEVQKSVGLNDSNSTLQPIGSDTLLYDNTTPEGRAYSRTVQIVIETPVK